MSVIPTLIRCLRCHERWEVDYEPTACACDDGGCWQISVDGGDWADESHPHGCGDE